MNLLTLSKHLFLFLVLLVFITSHSYSQSVRQKGKKNSLKEERFISKILNKEGKKKKRKLYAPAKRKKYTSKKTRNSRNLSSGKIAGKKRYPRRKSLLKTEKAVSKDLAQIMKAYEDQDWPFPSGKNFSKTVSPFYKKSLKTTNVPVTLSIDQKSPKQGDSILIRIKSGYKILKCFGHVAGQKINFISTRKHHEYHSYTGFDIQTAPGKKKILIAVLFKNNKIKYLQSEIEVLKNVVTKSIPVYVYKKKRIKIRVRRKVRGRVRIYRKWVTLRVRVKRWVKPPTAKDGDSNKKTLAQFQQELETKLQDMNQSDSMGGNDDDFYDSLPFNLGKKKLLKAKGNRALFKHQYKTSTPQQFWNGPFLQPTYPVKGGKVSAFGKYRIFRLRGRIKKGYHRGLDIAKPIGTPLHAPNYGMVVIAGKYGGKGNAVVINHGGGIYSVHYHLSKILVEKGTFVKKGQLIGKVGSTGSSTGPHLHWEIRIHGVSINTLQWRNRY